MFGLVAAGRANVRLQVRLIPSCAPSASEGFRVGHCDRPTLDPRFEVRP